MKHFIVYFQSIDGGFGGYNGGYAKNLTDAKKQMKEKLSKELYDRIIWKDTKWGKEADKADKLLMSLAW